MCQVSVVCVECTCHFILHVSVYNLQSSTLHVHKQSWVLGFNMLRYISLFLLTLLPNIYSEFIGNSGLSGVVSAWFVYASFSGINELVENNGNALQVRLSLCF